VFTDKVLTVVVVRHVMGSEQFDAVSFAVSVPHKLVLSETTVGAVGLPPIVIVITDDAGLVPQSFFHVAV